MAEKSSNETESSSGDGVRVVNDICTEMQDGIVLLAGERSAFDTKESWIANAGRIAGVSYRTAKTFFYKESENPNSKSVDKVRAVVAKLKHDEDAREAARIQQIKEATLEPTVLELRAALTALTARVETIGARIDHATPEAVGPGTYQEGQPASRPSRDDRDDYPDGGQ